MRAQKPFHWSFTSSDTGGVDDHLTIVGWGVHKMVMNIMLSQRMHSLTCITQNMKDETNDSYQIHEHPNMLNVDSSGLFASRMFWIILLQG